MLELRLLLDILGALSPVNAGSNPSVSARAMNFALHSYHDCSFPSNGSILMLFSTTDLFMVLLGVALLALILFLNA